MESKSVVMLSCKPMLEKLVWGFWGSGAKLLFSKVLSLLGVGRATCPSRLQQLHLIRCDLKWKKKKLN